MCGTATGTCTTFFVMALTDACREPDGGCTAAPTPEVPTETCTGGGAATRVTVAGATPGPAT